MPPGGDVEIVMAAKVAFAALFEGGGLAHKVPPDELKALVNINAVAAAKSWNESRGKSRYGWILTKTQWDTKGDIRSLLKHELCLTELEVRKRRAPRGRVHLEAPVSPDSDTTIGDWLRSSAPSPENLVHDRLLLERLDEALHSMPSGQAAAWRLNHQQGWLQAEIAELLGVSASRVSQLVTKANLCLAEVFADLHPSAIAA